MKKLIIDSSTSHIFTLGFEDNGTVAAVIHKSNYSRDDLIHQIYCDKMPEVVYIGKGPGSFTGLRNLFAYFSILNKISKVKVFSLPSLEIWRTALDPNRKFDQFIITLNRKLGFLQKNQGSYRLIEKNEAASEALIFDPSGYWDSDPIAIKIDESIESPWSQLLEQGNPISFFQPEYGFELDFLKKG